VFVSVGRPGGTPEIRRLAPSGEVLATTTWDQRALKFGAYRWLVDPTDDSLVGFRYDPGQVMRMSLRTGRVVDTFRHPYGLATPAIDGQGRIHLVCHAVFDGSCFDIAGAGAVVVYDHDGKRIAARRLYSEKGCAFAAPAFLARTVDGGIRALSTGFGTHAEDGPCAGTGIRAVDLTARLSLGPGYPIPYEKGYFVSTLDWIDIEDMAGTADGRTLLLEVAKEGGRAVEWDVPGMSFRYFRYRLREVGPDGRVLRSWGYGGTEPGVGQPTQVEIAADGAIWVLDSDPVERRAYTRYLPPEP
jgi:hypothetical protein